MANPWDELTTLRSRSTPILWKNHGMGHIDQNKAFIFGYYNAISRRPKTRQLLESYISDPSLVTYILAVEDILPAFEDTIDEMTGEGDRIIVRSTVTGQCHTGHDQLPELPRTITFPVAIGYYIHHNRITDHWVISDHLSMLEQLGWIISPRIDLFSNHKSEPS